MSLPLQFYIVHATNFLDEKSIRYQIISLVISLKMPDHITR